MADKDFVVKNGIVANTSFSANSTRIALGLTSTNVVITTSTISIGGNTIANSLGANNSFNANNAAYLGGTIASGYQTTAGLSANVATLTANNATNLGGTAAAGYQTTAGLAANVATLSANNATNLNGSAASTYVATTGNFSLSGVLTLTNATVATSTTTGALKVTGGVGIAGSLYAAVITSSGEVTAYSDERLKTEIKTIEDALNKVKQMRGVNYIKDSKYSTGVIAQEIQKVMPELVNSDSEYLSVAYGNIVGVLIEAIKELADKVDRLEKK